MCFTHIIRFSEPNYAFPTSQWNCLLNVYPYLPLIFHFILFSLRKLHIVEECVLPAVDSAIYIIYEYFSV